MDFVEIAIEIALGKRIDILEEFFKLGLISIDVVIAVPPSFLERWLGRLYSRS